MSALVLNNKYRIPSYLFQLQVIEDDKRNRSGVFSTAGKGTVPPLVTTPFLTQDQGRYTTDLIGS